MKKSIGYLFCILALNVHTLLSSAESISFENLDESSNEKKVKSLNAKQLYGAISNKDYGLINYLLKEDPTLIEKRLKVRGSSKEGEVIYFSPLIWAIKNVKDPQMVEILLHKGADWKRKVDGKSAFAHALMLDNPLIVSQVHFAMYAAHMYPGVSMSVVASRMKIDSNTFFCSEYILFLDKIFYALQKKYRDQESGKFIFNDAAQVALDQYEYLFYLTPLEVLLQEEQIDLLSVLCDMGIGLNGQGALGLPPLYLLIHKAVNDNQVVGDIVFSEVRPEIRALFDLLISRGAIVDKAMLEYAQSKQLPIALYSLLLNAFDEANKENKEVSYEVIERPLKRLCSLDIRES